ncbi:unnamed protein product [Caretta caretta]
MVKNIEKLQLWLLVLAGLSGAVAQSDLCGQVFVFPKESADAHVILNMNNNGTLQTFTMCLRYFTDLTRAFSLFSYATRTRDNEILLYKDKPGELSLKGLKKGYAINNQGVLIWAQDQDSFGGGFDAKQSFVGEIADVYM